VHTIIENDLVDL